MMGKAPQRTHLRPFIWGLVAFCLLALGGIGFLTWQRMQEGLSPEEAVNDLLSDVQEKHQDYEEFWEKKNPEAATEKEELESPPSGAMEPEALKMKLSGLMQFHTIVQKAGAEIHEPELFKEAEAVKSKAVRAFQSGQYPRCEKYIREALALYEQAEQGSKDIQKLNALYTEFTEKAKSEDLERMRAYPTEENQRILLLLEDRRQLGISPAKGIAIVELIMASYDVEARRAFQAEKKALRAQQISSIDAAVASGNVAQSLENIQTGLDKRLLETAEAIETLWPLMKKSTAHERNLHLPLKSGVKLSLVYISAETPYWMGQYEVRRREVQLLTPRALVEKGRNDDPAFGMSWYDAQAFCEALSELWKLRVTLPTEEQWQFACQAGSSTVYSFGDEVEDLKEYAHYCEGNCDLLSFSKVGRLKPNAWGLYDMHGNLMEWCSDPFDPSDPDGLKALRGGCWRFGADLCRSDARYRYLPNLGTRYIGFRIIVVPKG